MTWRIIRWDQGAADSGCGEKNVEYDITMIFAREDWVTNYQSDDSIGNNIEISGGLFIFPTKQNLFPPTDLSFKK